MQYVEILFIVSFGVYAIVLATHMFLSYLLFKSLKKNHAVYYKSIGEPTVVVLFKLADTEEDIARTYIRGLKGGAFGYRMIFRGIPKRFPRDAELRRLARAVRAFAAITLISFAVLIVIGYFLYEATS